MRKILRSGAYRFELLNRDESLLTFRNSESAITFLNRFKDRPEDEIFLRELYAARCRRDSSGDIDDLIRQLAELLVRGEVKILRSLDPRGGMGGEGQQPKPPGTGPPGPTPVKKSFIEVYLVDSEGKPVAGEKYRIKLPDGNTDEGKLDSFGHAEYYGINPGTCEWSFPDRDGNEYEQA